jgi:hypothetical protein
MHHALGFKEGDDRLLSKVPPVRNRATSLFYLVLDLMRINGSKFSKQRTAIFE